MSSLFRPEVLQARADHLHGEIILARSFSSWFLVAGAAVLAIIMMTYLFAGTYTKRTTVQGLLQPVQGAVRIQPPMSGTLIDSRVHEGQVVKKGEVLFIFSDERRNINSQDGARFSDIRTESLQQRRLNLEQTIITEQTLEKQNQREIIGRIKNLKDELERSQQEIELQNRRVSAAIRTLERHELMAKEGFISELALQEKDDQVSGQRAQLLALQRQQNQIVRNISSSQSELETIPNKSVARIAELKRALTVLSQESAELESRDRFAISAPIDGVITSITVQMGQVASGQTIANLLPKDGEIVAHLFAPSRAVGFIQKGQNVRLRYQAYPYQKYGQHKGTVLEVSRNPITPQDLPAMLQSAQEGMYRIVVRLDSSSLKIQDKAIQLLPGMVIDADIEQENRRLIEWIIEPVYTLKNRIE